MKAILNLSLLLLTTIVLAQNPKENCINNVTGKVLKKNSGKEITSALIQLKLNGNVVEETYSDADGSFSFQLKCASRYQISAVYENYSKSIKLVFTSNTNTDHILKLELIPLNEFKIENGVKKIVLEPIEFEPDDASITKESAIQLDMIVDILNKYNNLKIDIVFHTNNMGDLNFLKNLSQKRADACANFITSKGIDSNRINAVGLGFEKPVEKCNNDIMKQNKARCVENYRTEFIVNSEIIE